MKRWVIFLAVFIFALSAQGQKNYASTSVLSKGRWVKISTEGQGVFKITGSFLNEAGFTSPISSSVIQLFGQSGKVLPESNQVHLMDDLVELQIEVVDGGDGILDKEDYLLFYSGGANQWVYDSVQRKFQFLKNPYADLNYYFLQVGNDLGVRLKEKIILGELTKVWSQFTEHVRVERDSFNFLNSGREWYGHAFGVNQPSVRSFQLETNGAITGSRFELTSDVVGRSFENPNRLVVGVNGQTVLQHTTAPVLGTLLEPVANVSRLTTEGILSSRAIVAQYEFVPGSSNAQAWLNWFELVYKKELKLYNDSSLSFRDPSLLGEDQIVQFVLASSNPNLKVWEVTKLGFYQKLKTEFVANQYRFKDQANELKEYIAFDPARVPKPVLVGNVVNQNLHGEGFYDMVIVADPNMLNEAKRLAQFRRTNNGLRVLVTDPLTIYNEFSGGSPDPSAIRNFLKMFYDRAGSDLANRPKYLLLFGATSFKYKERTGEKTNLVPSYQSLSSLDPLTSYVSDDFFGYLDEEDDINTNIPAPMLDLAVGRIPARTIAQARMVVDKIIAYQTQSDYGPWRNELTLVADDEDFDLHFQDAEAHASIVEKEQTVWDLNKIYLDAFQQAGGTG
ncbi:MAG: type secretion system sortase PorU, partial [Bacteroidota bacterium]